ncbi:hypothetical protein NP493_247g02053 [Ridgeia piscesae]|uniref:Fibrinogen C-terminal domain-containing protein n=1 Tax=Ridgeia piscesae TaxID=27915 RepID=A0AAD9UD60_RIDPI|nr:hypothetical protein NP493_247g02053 [Ridgeia piscesae]
MSYWCEAKSCNTINNNVNTLETSVFQLHDSLEQQQQLQQKQQEKLNQTLYTQLAILKETVEQQQKQIQKQDRQLTTLGKTGEHQQKELKQAGIQYRNQIQQDCADLLNAGMSTSGVYNIYVAGKTVPVWCDMTGGEGWLVIQRRVDNTTDFYQGWKSYQDGFGDLARNFWLGNDNLHAITAQKNYSLRVDLADFEGNSRYAEYTEFAVANEDNMYRLTVRSYNGTAGDSLSYHDGMAFSTPDRDNDRLSSVSCAQFCKGGWWYKRCHLANLNGLYLGGANTPAGEAISWIHWYSATFSLKTVAMKIRPQ